MAKRFLGAAIAVALAGGWFAAAGEPGDRDRLQGEWALTSMGASGKSMPEDVARLWKLEVKGDEWLSTIGGFELRMTYKLDPTKTPKEFEFTVTHDGRPFTWMGLYELDGDTLTACWPSMAGAERPKELKAGDWINLAVYKRKAKK